MPAILTTPEEVNTWLTAPWGDASPSKALARQHACHRAPRDKARLQEEGLLL